MSSHEKEAGYGQVVTVCCVVKLCAWIGILTASSNHPIEFTEHTLPPPPTPHAWGILRSLTFTALAS